MYDLIVVPVDGSEASQHATKHALSLAEITDATVHLLNVVSLNESRNIDVQLIEQGHLYQELRKIGEQIIDETLAPINKPTIPIERKTLTGRPDKQILAYIVAQQPDLVIMGSQGKTGIKRVVLGSVAENVARRSTVPVQLIPSPDKSAPVIDTFQHNELNTE